MLEQRIVTPLATMCKQYRKTTAALVEKWATCKESYQVCLRSVVSALLPALAVRMAAFVGRRR